MKTKARLFKITLIFLSLILGYQLVSPAFLSNQDAYAVGDLTVNWGVPEGNPIFTINNFVPGQTVSKQVAVTNNATVTRAVGVKGAKLNETGNIAQAINFVISQNGTDLYGGTLGTKTLANFFADSAGTDGVFLSNLNSSVTTNYIFKATFKPDAGNVYQGKSVSFDLKIGISGDLPAQCRNIVFSKTIFGKQGNDVLIGTSRNDLIYGMDGHDVIISGGGNDCIIGGDGNDVLIGDGGNDILIGGANFDIASGGPGTDTCQAEIRAACER